MAVGLAEHGEDAARAAVMGCQVDIGHGFGDQHDVVTLIVGLAGRPLQSRGASGYGRDSWAVGSGSSNQTPPGPRYRKLRSVSVSVSVSLVSCTPRVPSSCGCRTCWPGVQSLKVPTHRHRAEMNVSQQREHQHGLRGGRVCLHLHGQPCQRRRPPCRRPPKERRNSKSKSWPGTRSISTPPWTTTWRKYSTPAATPPEDHDLTQRRCARGSHRARRTDGSCAAAAEIVKKAQTAKDTGRRRL